MNFTSAGGWICSFPSHNHLMGRVVVSKHNLAFAADPERVLYYVTDDLTREVTRKAFSRCMTTTTHEKTQDVTVEIDCYVFSRAELEELLLNARAQGRYEADRWPSSQD